MGHLLGPERQGDALFDIAAFYNKNHDSNERPRDLPNVTISADVSTIITDTPEGLNVDTQRPMSAAFTATYVSNCRIDVILRNADGSPAQLRNHHLLRPITAVQTSRISRRRLPLRRL